MLIHPSLNLRVVSTLQRGIHLYAAVVTIHRHVAHNHHLHTRHHETNPPGVSMNANTNVHAHLHHVKESHHAMALHRQLGQPRRVSAMNRVRLRVDLVRPMAPVLTVSITILGKRLQPPFPCLPTTAYIQTLSLPHQHTPAVEQRHSTENLVMRHTLALVVVATFQALYRTARIRLMSPLDLVEIMLQVAATIQRLHVSSALAQVAPAVALMALHSAATTPQRPPTHAHSVSITLVQTTTATSQASRPLSKVARSCLRDWIRPRRSDWHSWKRTSANCKI